MPLDYSKWKTIEVSDDEDDTHPNIDTPSLFRWRHRARVERMEAFNERKTKHEEAFNSLQNLKAEIANEKDEIKKHELTEKYEKDMENWQTEEHDIKEEERKAPWNVDTLSKEKFSKTIINKIEKEPEVDDESTYGDCYIKFLEKNESNAKHFGMLRKVVDSEKFLCDHTELVCEYTANYLVIWCIDLEMMKKHELMAHVARQAITLQFILELAKTLKKDPRACVRPFFAKMKTNEIESVSGFTEELEAFKNRIRVRAQQKMEEYIKEEQEKERQSRLGPGGLDPVEVMETLPESLRKCFETQDTEMLKDVLTSMKPEDAEYHFDRCIKSGLWVPGPDDKSTDEKEKKPEDVEETN